MSAEMITVLKCDGCGMIAPFAVTAEGKTRTIAQQRAVARKAWAWRSDRRRRGKGRRIVDLCEDCVFTGRSG